MPIRDWVLGQAVTALVRYKSRPDAVRNALARSPYPRAATPARDRVKVGVVQMQMDLVDDGAAFALKYYALVRQAVERGAQLIVFPEYAWLPILGLLPPVRALAEKGVTLEGAVNELAPGGGLTLTGVFQTIAPAVKRIMETTAAELAVRFGAYLMPGTAITTDAAGHLYNTAYLYGPDGGLIGTQNKMHPTAMEVEWMTCGSALEVWTLPFARMAMPVCMDFTYWETARCATVRGADILLDMSADATGDQPYLAARGDESRIQESFAFSTRAYAVTQLFGLDFCGPSHIAAPLGLYPEMGVYLAQAETRDREEIVVAELDLERLRAFQLARQRDWNYGLYDRYLPQAYADYRTRVTQDGKRKVDQ